PPRGCYTSKRPPDAWSGGSACEPRFVWLEVFTMKLVTFIGKNGTAVPGVINKGSVIDLQAAAPKYAPALSEACGDMLSLIAASPHSLSQIFPILAAHGEGRLDPG